MRRLSTNSALWLTRVFWVITYATALAAISSASDAHASTTETASMTGWGAAAFVVFVELVVCGPISLTVVRMIVPASVVAASLTLFFGAAALPGALALTAAVVVTLLTFTAETGEAIVRVAAYGDERRFPLRVPAAMQIPIAVSWLLWIATLVTGLLLLEAHKLVGGSIVLLLAAAFTWAEYRRLRPFSSRWLVSVPAGVVVHDPLVLHEQLAVHARLADALASIVQAQLPLLVVGESVHGHELAMRDVLGLCGALIGPRHFVSCHAGCDRPSHAANQVLPVVHLGDGFADEVGASLCEHLIAVLVGRDLKLSLCNARRVRRVQAE